MHLEPLDLARLFVGTAVLAFASYTDWRWRRAPDALWLVAGGAGAVLLAAQLATTPGPLLGEDRERLLYLGVAAVFAGMTWGMYWLGILAGGADAKALMAIAVLVPFPVHLGVFPLEPSLMPPAFAVLGNALLAFLAVPVGLLLRNLAQRHVAWPFSFLAVRMPVEEAKRKHVWPMQYVDAETGQVRRMLMPSRYVWEDEDYDALREAGRAQVWVTPKVPFMIPLLAGFVSAFLLGDLLFGNLFPALG